MSKPSLHPGERLPVLAREPEAGNYFVAAYPPFSRWRREMVELAHERLDRPSSDPSNQPFGLYVHFPFCAKRCDFCYYLSYDDQAQRVEEYLDALIAELSLYRERPALRGRRLDFVYFGGGTPSLLSPSRLERLFGGLKQSFDWDAAREVTFECAPNTVTPTKLQILKEEGVSRLSLGVQQLDDRVLRQSGRVHLVADVERAYADLRAVGFDIINLDLIAGLTGETDETFRRSLEQVITMAPESVTIYQLEVPRNTPLYQQLRPEAEAGQDSTRLTLPSWGDKRARLGEAFSRLEESGYQILTAYAAVRDPRRHRFLYMSEQYQGVDLLGIGASAFSYLDGVHSQNLGSLNGYLEAVSSDRLPLARSFALNDDERLVREFVLQLKLGEVDIEAFRRKFDVDITERFAQALRRTDEAGFVRVDSRKVTLTREGLLRVDGLIPLFYPAESQGIRYT